jgi:peptidoglycan hydrolase-like protein with peptidoglycan-binding domain
MYFGKLKAILILGLLILTPVPPGFGQAATCYDLWGPSQLPTQFMSMSGYYGVGPTAFAAEDIRSIQIALRNRGFYFGDFNGMLTLGTIDAVQRFQAANNLRVSGILDTRTQMALGVTIKGSPASTIAYSGFDFSACNPPMKPPVH